MRADHRLAFVPAKPGEADLTKAIAQVSQSDRLSTDYARAGRRVGTRSPLKC